MNAPSAKAPSKSWEIAFTFKPFNKVGFGLIACIFVLIYAAVLIGQASPTPMITFSSKAFTTPLPKGQHEGWQIYLLDPNTGIQYPLTHDDNLTMDRFIWSPDGKKIGFAINVPGKPIKFVVRDWISHTLRAMTFYDTWMMPIMKRDINHIHEWNASKSEQVWHENGVIFICDSACVRARHGCNTDCTEIYCKECKLVTSETGNNINPVWSPDGQQIVFASNRGGSNYEIFVMNHDGSDIRQLTFNSKFTNWYPIWSPGGR